MLWLAPRLYFFASACPETELGCATSHRLLDFDHDDVVFVIRFRQGFDDSYHTRTLADEWATLMRTSELVERIGTSEDLARLTLLQDDLKAAMARAADRPAWFAPAAHPPPERLGPRFNQADHAVGAALAGIGAIMGRASLTEAAFREVRLVMPFKLVLKAKSKYRLASPQRAEQRPHVADFMDWFDGSGMSARPRRESRVARTGEY